MPWLKGQEIAGSINIAKKVTFTKDVVFSGTCNFQTAVVDLTNAQIKALRATPKTLVAAPGADKWLEFVSATFFLDYGTNVFTETDDNLSIRYTGASGTILATAETTGFIDATADSYMQLNYGTNKLAVMAPVSATAAIVNQPLVLHNSGDGEFGGNAGADTLLKVYIVYRTHTIDT